MADYIYLLESRLSKAQQQALNTLREIARERSLTIFLVGGAVRDLTSGSPVRDLDVVVQGNATKLKKDIEKAGGLISGENEPGHSLYLRFPGSVRVELGSTLTLTYPKPGKPAAKPSTILDDLRRRDFTANAMALSLNVGSYGLLMDPLNGVADIENRELRLVSNYGFIEDPIRMVRAARLMARLGWQMDEKTAARYETGKLEGYISAASAFSRGYEAEEIVHEEDPLRVLKRLEAEGWMNEIAPGWTSGKANEAELERLRESQTKLQLQGIHPSPAAANFPLLTARMTPPEVSRLKQAFPRQGFVSEIDGLDAEAKELATQLTSKSAALPSQTWKLLHAARPEAVLQVTYSSKSATIQTKLKNFFTEWPQARQKVPYTLMQEMRIVPELAGYEGFVDSLVFELMDGKLDSVEDMKAFLEPFSPPAPPPPVNLRRARASKKESKGAKGRGKKAAAAEESEPEPLLLANQGSDADFDPDAEIDIPDVDVELPDADVELPEVDAEEADSELDEESTGTSAPKSRGDVEVAAGPVKSRAASEVATSPAPKPLAPRPIAGKKTPLPVSATTKLPARIAAKPNAAPKPPSPAAKTPARQTSAPVASKTPEPTKAAKKPLPAKSTGARKPEPAKKAASKVATSKPSPTKAAAKPVSKAPAKTVSAAKPASKAHGKVPAKKSAATKPPAKTAKSKPVKTVKTPNKRR